MLNFSFIDILAPLTLSYHLRRAQAEVYQKLGEETEK